MGYNIIVIQAQGTKTVQKFNIKRTEIYKRNEF